MGAVGNDAGSTLRSCRAGLARIFQPRNGSSLSEIARCPSIGRDLRRFGTLTQWVNTNTGQGHAQGSQYCSFNDKLATNFEGKVVILF